MKRKAVFLISTILVFCLAGCGADNSSGNQDHADNTPAVSSGSFVENIPAAVPEAALGERRFLFGRAVGRTQGKTGGK